MRKNAKSETVFNKQLCASSREEPPRDQIATPNLVNEFARARHYSESNWLVQPLQFIRQGFYNFGFRIKNDNIPSKKLPSRFEDWKRQKGETVRRLVLEIWREWQAITNVIVYWREGARPILLPPEKCRYTDRMGIERLFVRHELTQEEINLLPPKLQAIYRNNTEVEIRPEDGQYFKVLKLKPLGQGLSRPEMVAIFPACQAIENLDASDCVLSLEARTLVRQHTLGHETRVGVNQGTSKNFINRERMEAVQKVFKGRTGLIETFANFDQLIKHFHLDTKWFDAKKYDGSINKILSWTQPVGQMVSARGGVAPFLMDILRAQALGQRETLQPFLESIITEAFKPPVDIKVGWSTRIFRDTRLQADLLKFGIGGGLVSQKSGREEIGYDDEEERAQKKLEAEQSKSETFPIYDPAHGPPENAATKSKGGRPLGEPDQGKTT